MSWLMTEYLCRCGHRTESLEVRGDVSTSVPCEACGRRASRCLSSPKVKTVWASAATQGRSDPPPSPTAMDTRAIWEGQTVKEWRKERKKVWQEHDRKQRRKAGAPI